MTSIDSVPAERFWPSRAPLGRAYAAGALAFPSGSSSIRFVTARQGSQRNGHRRRPDGL
jgi:hypothetical protein